MKISPSQARGYRPKGFGQKARYHMTENEFFKALKETPEVFYWNEYEELRTRKRSESDESVSPLIALYRYRAPTQYVICPTMICASDILELDRHFVILVERLSYGYRPFKQEDIAINAKLVKACKVPPLQQ